VGLRIDTRNDKHVCLFEGIACLAGDLMNVRVSWAVCELADVRREIRKEEQRREERKKERTNERKDGRSRRAAPDSFMVQLGFHVQEKRRKGKEGRSKRTKKD